MNKNLGYEEWLNYNQLGIDIWSKKYRYKDETFEHWLDRVSNGNKEIRRLILERKFLFAGRTLANRGTNNGANFSNCFTKGAVNDSLNDIMKVCTDIALTFKKQGGQGLSLSKIRPKGAPIQGQHQSDGIVPFMELFNQVTATIQQGASRRGALMMSIDIWHKQAAEFITIKSDLQKINNANLSLECNDEFWQIVEQSLKEDREIIVEREFTCGNGEVIKYDVCPVKLFKLICLNAWKHAEPGVFYHNRFCNYNLMEKDDEYEIVTSNPCFTGDTEILTDKGYIPIKDLVCDSVNVWNGEQWSKVLPRVTGFNEHVNKVTFTNGTSFTCTDYHKLPLVDGMKELRDCKVGDALIKWDSPIIEGRQSLDDRLAYSLGFFVGAGHFDNKYPLIYLSNEKIGLNKYFVDGSINYATKEKNNVRYYIREHRSMFKKDYVPDCNMTTRTRLKWLAGFLDCRGNRNYEGGSIDIDSVNISLLKDVLKMLNTLGVNGNIRLNNSCRKKRFHVKGKDTTKIYSCNSSYRLSVYAKDINTLKSLGLETYRLDLEKVANTTFAPYVRIKSIEDANFADKTYCLTEHKRHTLVANGCISGNCGEQPLPTDGACNLASLNIAGYVVNSYKENAYFDFDEFLKDVKIAVWEMDRIIDENIPNLAIPEQMERAKNYRNLGLGIMGIADCLCMLGLTYGSDKAVEFIADLGKKMFRTAVYASVEKAEQYGSFPKYKPCLWDSSIIEFSFTKEEIEELKRRNAMRNCSLLSIAPTGCVSGQTLLCTENGFLYMDEVVNANGKSTQLLMPLNLLGEAGQEVCEKGFINESVEALDITTSDGISLICSPNHRVRVINEGLYEWKSAKDLVLGDKVVKNVDYYHVYNRSTPMQTKGSKKSFPNTLNDDLAYLIGVYCNGDGCCLPYDDVAKSIMFYLHSKDKDGIELLQTKYEFLFGERLEPFEALNDNYVCLKSNSPKVYKYFETNNLFYYNSIKRVPHCIRRADRKTILHFLAGLFVNNYGGNKVKFVDKHFASDVAVLASACGVMCSVTRAENVSEIHYSAATFELVLNGGYNLGFSAVNKGVINPANVAKADVGVIDLEENVSVVEVASIEKVTEQTLDIETSNTHSYVSNGFISHNSIATMFDISTGIEPFFALTYYRKTISLNGGEDKYYPVDISAVKDYKAITGNEELPKCFITSANIHWKDRIKMQGALQNYIDTSISSTINLPKETTLEDVEKIYLEGWKAGLKGVTIYRDGSRSPILSTSIESVEEFKPNNAPKRPKELEAEYFEIKANGAIYCVCVGLLNDRPYEVFAFEKTSENRVERHKGKIIKKSKGCYSFLSEKLTIDNLVKENVNLEARLATLYISGLLRHSAPLAYIVKTIRKGSQSIASFSSAICRVLNIYIREGEQIKENEVCPECGGKVEKIGGCMTCINCGWSKCG